MEFSLQVRDLCEYLMNRDFMSLSISYSMNQNYKTKLSFGIPILGISIFFICFALTNIDTRGDDEWSNNATLIAEVGVGIIVTLFVVMISRLNEHKMDMKISNVLNIVEEREKIRREKEEQVYHSIFLSFKEIQEEIAVVLNEAKLYEKSKDHIEKKKCKDQIMLNCNRIKEFSKITLDDPNKISLEFFHSDTLEIIKTISSICKDKPEFNKDGKTVNISFCNILKDMIEPRIAELNKKIIDETRSEQPQMEANNEGMLMSVASDRTVYPLNSIMHMRASLPYVIENKKIIFEMFNSERKLLLSQTIDPEKYDDPKFAGTNTFQVCFKMEGAEWKVGETYIVKAIHGSLSSEDSFTIDQRMPIILSDKPVYTIGSDMILTVIDPDADKDNEVAEFIGDRKDSKLIIESKYGKIDGYGLRETGNSTGIFQGIIGILGIEKNGTVIPQNFNGKTIDKIQGTGIVDGFIGGAPGDEITIRYKNSINVISLSVSISNL